MVEESQQGNELTTSGDIEPDSSGELSLSPNMAGTLQYYCVIKQNLGLISISNILTRRQSRQLNPHCL
jgi:hypothetical protein